MALMISVSGIRGIFGTDLTPENLTRFTAAFGTWLKGGRVVLGRDSRTTTPGDPPTHPACGELLPAYWCIPKPKSYALGVE